MVNIQENKNLAGKVAAITGGSGVLAAPWQRNLLDMACLWLF